MLNIILDERPGVLKALCLDTSSVQRVGLRKQYKKISQWGWSFLNLQQGAWTCYLSSSGLLYFLWMSRRQIKTAMHRVFWMHSRPWTFSARFSSEMRRTWVSTPARACFNCQIMANQCAKPLKFCCKLMGCMPVQKRSVQYLNRNPNSEIAGLYLVKTDFL